jgi:hypothetical protein
MIQEVADRAERPSAAFPTAFISGDVCDENLARVERAVTTAVSARRRGDTLEHTNSCYVILEGSDVVDREVRESISVRYVAAESWADDETVRWPGIGIVEWNLR